METLASKLASLPVRSLSFGYRTIKLVGPDELDNAQVGYARSPNSEEFTGDGDGEWKPAWVVIGNEDECGDPIFVDTSDLDFPVYTATHGEGDWEPQLIAESLSQFSKALRYLKPLSQGRESPVALEANPIEDLAEVLEKVGDLTACPDATFWTDWLGGHSAE